MMFKSKIENSLIGLIGGHAILLFAIVGIVFSTNGFRITNFDWIYMILLIPYFFGIYLYAGLFNNDIIVDNSKIEIVNSIPFFRKRVSFDYSAIKSITLRHDWTETFGRRIKSNRVRYVLSQLTQIFLPYNYKWIKIETYRKFRFFCFGIDFDYYNNDGPLFEDVYKALRRKHKSVKWTNNTSPYYVGLIKMTEWK
jgi:hypothetical protein